MTTAAVPEPSVPVLPGAVTHYGTATGGTPMSAWAFIMDDTTQTMTLVKRGENDDNIAEVRALANDALKCIGGLFDGIGLTIDFRYIWHAPLEDGSEPVSMYAICSFGGPRPNAEQAAKITQARNEAAERLAALDVELIRKDQSADDEPVTPAWLQGLFDNLDLAV